MNSIYKYKLAIYKKDPSSRTKSGVYIRNHPKTSS